MGHDRRGQRLNSSTRDERLVTVDLLVSRMLGLRNAECPRRMLQLDPAPIVRGVLDARCRRQAVLTIGVAVGSNQRSAVDAVEHDARAPKPVIAGLVQAPEVSFKR